MPFAASVRCNSAVSASRLKPISSRIFAAPQYNRSRCWSRKSNAPLCNRNPSHTPSPTTKPPSKMDTLAASRGTSRPLRLTNAPALRASAAKSWLPCIQVISRALHYVARSAGGCVAAPSSGEWRSGDIMRMAEYAESDACALAGALREGGITQSEVIQAARSACAALNPSLNAVLEFYDDALDRVVDAGVGDFAQRSPLAGVPILRKDVGATEAGRLQECGSRLLVGHRTARNSAYVELCRRAGMIFVGRSAVGHRTAR